MMTQAYTNQILATVPTLNRYALALTRNSLNAEDLVQDTVQRALEKHERYAPETNFRAWLFAIMHNLFCDERRRQQRRRECRVPDQLDRLSDSVDAGTYEVLYDFMEAFSRLSEPAREVLILIGVEGMSYEEAADQLGVAVGTIKSRLFRARENLRDQMNEPA